MKPIYRRALFVLAIAALPGIAAAEDAFTMHPTDIYAGPDSEYPVIAQLPPNTEVGVAGCLSDWSWCDVRLANDRGWVYAGDLGYPYEGRRVAIIEFGPRLHIPAVTFALNTYWDAHYRSRPFFRERQQWAGRVHVEANRGGRPPHGGASVAEHRGQPAQAPTAQGPQPSRERQHAQGMQQRQNEATAQRRENEPRAQNDQHAKSLQQAPREQAAQQAEQRRQAQEGSRTSNGQAQSAARSREEQHAQTAQSPAARTPPEQHAQQQGRMAQAPQREARANANANTPRGEAERGNARSQQREQPKEERKEANQQ